LVFDDNPTLNWVGVGELIIYKGDKQPIKESNHQVVLLLDLPFF